MPAIPRKVRIESLLTAAFRPLRLRVSDDSADHEGHAGARPGGETHFSIEIEAESLAALPRLERHRAIHAALAPEFADGLHALAIKA